MKLSHKDKSFLLLVAAALVVIWALFSIFSTLFFTATYRVSDASKIISDKDQQWLNVSRPLKISDLEDRIILLDFWSYACISCLDALPELVDMQKEFGSKLVIIGVHSAKFENEKENSTVRKAVLKHDISYPVVNDSDLKIWKSFKVKLWPTYVLINPHGSVVKTFRGETDLGKVKGEVKKLISKYKYEIERDPLPILLEKYSVIGNVLDFPTKLEYAASLNYKGRTLPAIFIANTGQNNIVASTLSGDMIVKIGSGKVGFSDGSFDVAAFSAPRGLLFDNNKLYVADTGNHALRVIDFKEMKVSTLIGSGAKGEVMEKDFNEARKTNLASPNDLEFFPDKNTIVISNAGTNQILSYNLKRQTVSVLAGNGVEGDQDGKYPESSLAQTSDMSAFGHKLYFVDALSSSLRVIDESGNVKTLIGNKSKFGHENGDRSRALMQHPMGLNVDDTGAYISDSFNHTIRKYDFGSAQIRDLVGAKRGDEIGAKTRFDEPDGIITVLDRFYIADTNNNRILIVSRGSLNSELLDVMPPLKLPKEGFLEYLPNLEKIEEAQVKAGAEILIKIDLKAGWKINESGPSFINLLEVVKDTQANLVSSFDWHSVKTKEMKLPKLEEDKDYLLQGTIYYCEDKRNALCYIKSYEQKITADDDEKSGEIVIKLGE